MADSDKLESDELGEVDDLDTAKEAETAEGSDVVNDAAEERGADEGGIDAAEADPAEADGASAKGDEEDVKAAAKDSGKGEGPEEAPAKGKKGKKRASKKDAAKGSSEKDGSSEGETTDEASKTSRKQKESSAESSKKGSKKSSGNPEKGTKRSIEKKAAEKRASSKERKPTRVKGLQSPKWWAPLLVTLMIVGLVIVVSAYIFGGNFPIKGLGNGNLFIGFGALAARLIRALRPRIVEGLIGKAPLPEKTSSGIAPYGDDDGQRLAERREGDGVDDPPFFRRKDARPRKGVHGHHPRDESARVGLPRDPRVGAQGDDGVERDEDQETRQVRPGHPGDDELGAQQAEDRARSADRGGEPRIAQRVGGEDDCGIPGDGREKVDPQVPGVPDGGLENGSEHPQHVHVEQQVPKAGMHERRSEETIRLLLRELRHEHEIGADRPLDSGDEVDSYAGRDERHCHGRSGPMAAEDGQPSASAACGASARAARFAGAGNIHGIPRLLGGRQVA